MDASVYYRCPSALSVLVVLCDVTCRIQAATRVGQVVPTPAPCAAQGLSLRLTTALDGDHRMISVFYLGIANSVCLCSVLCALRISFILSYSASTLKAWK